MNKTIELSIKDNVAYYISDLTEKQVDDIIINKNNSDELQRISVELGINAKGIEVIGSVEKASKFTLSRYVSYLKGYKPSLKNKDRKVQYRDYSRTEEQQLINAHLVSMCEDSRTSINTALRVLELPYLCVWKKEL